MVGNVEPGNAALNPALSILKEIDILGSAHATVSDLEAVIRLVADGAIVPEIAATLPLEQAADAHRMMEQRATSGRVVLLHDTGEILGS
jgi:D-arabinose 1-dehydrogenase-like Zn-dependent alcohol dehydrogenase